MSRVPPTPPAADLLVRRAQQGEVAAFEGLYRQHVGRVLALVVRMVGGDQARAEELTQQAFVRAWKNLGRFRGDAAFGTWLHRIAVRVVLDDARSPWSRRRGAHPDEGSHHADPTRRLDLEAAIRTLPDKARRVFVLHDVEGWRHHEIAEALGVSVGTSKSQLSRARSLLRERLVR